MLEGDARTVVVTILLAVGTTLSLLGAIFLRVRNRKEAILAVFVNFIIMGGTWGGISFAIRDVAAFAVAEVYAFGLMGFSWRTNVFLGVRWVLIAAVAVCVLAFIKNDLIAVGLAIIYALYARAVCCAPSRVVAWTFSPLAFTPQRCHAHCCTDACDEDRITS